MKNQHVMSELLLLVGIMLIPAYTTHADIAGRNNREATGSMNLHGNIQDGSMSPHTYGTGGLAVSSSDYGIGAGVSQSTAALIGNFMDGLGIFVSNPSQSDTPKVDQKPVTKTRITAYASTPDQTDDTPFTTASGTGVRDGIIASNFLPFGTRIIIPSLFGNRVFTVEDRMNPRYRHSVDIWMSNNSHALHFGVQYAEIQVVGSAKQDSQQLALSL